MGVADFEAALDQFAGAPPISQREALPQLLASRTRQAAIADQRFARGVERLKQSAVNAEGVDQLVAVAALMRISGVQRGQQGDLTAAVREGLRSEPGPALLLGDPDDRTYLGRACELAALPWCVEYSARAAVAEEAGAKAREAFVRSLLVSAPDVSTALRAIGHEWRGWSPDTETPADSAGRRLRRLLASISKAVNELGASLEVAAEDGELLAALITNAVIGYEDKPSRAVAEGVAEAVAGATHQLVRARFSVATSSSTYAAIRAARRWLSGHAWSQFADRSESLAWVAGDIYEALLILARQGLTDSALRDALVVARGSREKAAADLLRAASSPGVPSAARDWLATGRSGSDAPSDRSARGGRREEEALADLLVDAVRFRSSENRFRHASLPELEVLDPDLASELKRLLNQALGLADGTEALGRRRRLRPRGEPGEVEDYAPLEHDLVESGDGGVRRVRILRPVVERIEESGIPHVVRKGLAEPAND